MKMRAVIDYEVDPFDYSVEHVSVETQHHYQFREVLENYTRLHITRIQVEKVHDKR